MTLRQLTLAAPFLLLTGMVMGQGNGVEPDSDNGGPTIAGPIASAGAFDDK